MSKTTKQQQIINLKFAIGDKVINKKLGLPFVGQVVGIVFPICHMIPYVVVSEACEVNPFLSWNNFYKEWETGPGYFISVPFSDLETNQVQSEIGGEIVEAALLTIRPEADLELFS